MLIVIITVYQTKYHIVFSIYYHSINPQGFMTHLPPTQASNIFEKVLRLLHMRVVMGAIVFT